MTGRVCARCHQPIPTGAEMVEKIGGRYVPTHRDCGFDLAATRPKWRSLDTMIHDAFSRGPCQDLKRKHRKEQYR